jgi:hypothetical protein
MNFVNKKYIASRKVGENGSEITDAFERWSSRHLHTHIHLVSDNMGKGSLAQPRIAVEKDMLNRLAASFSRLN